MPKITLIGAGSGFTQPLLTDILNIEGLEDGVINLVDIDAKRLEVNVKLMRHILCLMGKKKWEIAASTNRRDIMSGTDYLISVIEVSGVPCVRFDNDIPLKYGIDQCVGDTIGPGGIMKALRTLPSFLDIMQDAQRYCPNALVMNYTNPMSIITLGAARISNQSLIGLCHSVQGNSRQIADILGVPYEELEWQCGGINHMAWFTKLNWHGQDMYPRLRYRASCTDVIKVLPIRADLLKNLGYFSTESCGHFSEYVPYYRKRKDLLKRYGLDKSSGSYASSWPTVRKMSDKHRKDMATGKCSIPLTRSFEYAADIIEAHIFDRKKVIYASVKNTCLIPNLPQTGVVEVATLVDKRGYMPVYFGDLPEQCAALCRSNMSVFELCVEGILKNNREAVIHAMMLDPLSAAVCSLGEIRTMAEELFAAEKDYIPKWCARPQNVVAPMTVSPLTNFVRTFQVSKPLSRIKLVDFEYPDDKSVLDFTERTFESGFTNIRNELRKAGSAIMLFMCHIKCLTSMKLQAKMGYDGPVKMWLDSKELFNDPNGTNPAGIDKGKVIFVVGKGKHEVLLALDSNMGYAEGIRLRFERLDISKHEEIKGIMPNKLPTFVEENFERAIESVSPMAARRLEKKNHSQQ